MYLRGRDKVLMYHTFFHRSDDMTGQHQFSFLSLEETNHFSLNFKRMSNAHQGVSRPLTPSHPFPFMSPLSVSFSSSLLLLLLLSPAPSLLPLLLLLFLSSSPLFLSLSSSSSPPPLLFSFSSPPPLLLSLLFLLFINYDTTLSPPPPPPLLLLSFSPPLLLLSSSSSSSPLLLSSLSFLFSLPQPQEYYDEQNAAEELAGQVCMVSHTHYLSTLIY